MGSALPLWVLLTPWAAFSLFFRGSLSVRSRFLRGAGSGRIPPVYVSPVNLVGIHFLRLVIGIAILPGVQALQIIGNSPGIIRRGCQATGASKIIPPGAAVALARYEIIVGSSRQQRTDFILHGWPPLY